VALVIGVSGNHRAAILSAVFTAAPSTAAAGVGIEIDETALPLRPEVRGVCEILGLAALAAMQSTPAGTGARIIGRAVGQHPSLVTLRTLLGRTRILDVLVGE
jgi:hydrogenase expression/formation protein HypE